MANKDLLYRWEHNNRGLEHNCGTCNHNLASPRAKRTCFGIHEEVCIRYHKTLHFVGYSHKCDACHRSEELHDKRHREIGVLRNSLLQLIGKDVERTLTAKELEKIHESLHPTPESFVRRGAPSKGNTNLAKNKITNANNASSLTTPNCTSPQRAANHKKSPSKNGNKKPSSDIPTEYDSQITAILQRLGICKNNNNTSSSSSTTPKPKKYHSLLTQLRHAIYLDLISVENEEREIMMRMAGYWRYVNRRTYNAMVRHNQLWDWATGGKLEELDLDLSGESDDLTNDDDGDDDERADDSTRKRKKAAGGSPGGKRAKKGGKGR